MNVCWGGRLLDACPAFVAGEEDRPDATTEYKVKPNDERDFVPSPAGFAGYKEGYAFKKDLLGLGYYRDGFLENQGEGKEIEEPCVDSHSLPSS